MQNCLCSVAIEILTTQQEFKWMVKLNKMESEEQDIFIYALKSSFDASNPSIQQVRATLFNLFFFNGLVNCNSTNFG